MGYSVKRPKTNMCWKFQVSIKLHPMGFFRSVGENYRVPD
jgi:hypothetical protein